MGGFLMGVLIELKTTLAYFPINRIGDKKNHASLRIFDECLTKENFRPVFPS